MARIEIFDDWGKLRETIEIVSADAGDVRRDIELMLENDYHQCNVCKMFSNERDPDNDLEYFCATCHAAHNPPPAEKDSAKKTALESNCEAYSAIRESRGRKD